MTKVALELITDTHLVALVNKFDKDFKNILQHWFGCMRFMMRTGRRTRAEITSFRNQREEIRVAIINICTDFEPLTLPTTTKWHIFLTPGCAFDLELDNWEITGSGDEQNTETSHAEMNSIERQVGNCRGAKKKELMAEKFAIGSIPCIF